MEEWRDKMTYKLNQTLYVIGSCDFLIHGRVENRKIIKYYPNDTSLPESEYQYYMVNDNWYIEDQCFSSKKKAVKILNKKINREIERLLQCKLDLVQAEE